MYRLLTAALLSALLAGPVLAGEGAGNPFPFSVPGVRAPAVSQDFDVGQAHLPELPDSYDFAFNGVPTTQPESREGVVQTAGSLPRNALVGTVEYAQARNVARWFASNPGLRTVADASPVLPGR